MAGQISKLRLLSNIWEKTLKDTEMIRIHQPKCPRQVFVFVCLGLEPRTSTPRARSRQGKGQAGKTLEAEGCIATFCSNSCLFLKRCLEVAKVFEDTPIIS